VNRDADQLDLFAPPLPDIEQPLTFHKACHHCDPPRIIAAVPVEGGPGARWDAAEKWCYIAHCTHLREDHPERVHDHLADRGLPAED
jgi:hypothetical protein